MTRNGVSVARVTSISESFPRSCMICRCIESGRLEGALTLSSTVRTSWPTSARLRLERMKILTLKFDGQGLVLSRQETKTTSRGPRRGPRTSSRRPLIERHPLRYGFSKNGPPGRIDPRLVLGRRRTFSQTRHWVNHVVPNRSGRYPSGSIDRIERRDDVPGQVKAACRQSRSARPPQRRTRSIRARRSGRGRRRRRRNGFARRRS